MHHDFHELLAAEDEPGFSPDRRAELEAEPESALALAGLRRRRAALRELPPLTPAGDAWARTLARHRAGLRRPTSAYGRYAGLAAGFAALAMVSWLLPRIDWPEPAGLGGGQATMDVAVAPPAPAINEKAPATAAAPVRVVPPTPGSGVPNPYETYPYSTNLEQLLADSRRLERLLRAAPGRDAAAPGDLAARMAELERRLAVIDEGLNHAGMGAMDASYTEPLLRERVDLMGQLLRVRYDGAGAVTQ